MTQTEESINLQFKIEYQCIQQAEDTAGFISRPEEQRLSDWYKDEHNKLIAIRENERRAAEREANNERVCEVCLTKLPIKKGKPPKRCEDHR